MIIRTALRKAGIAARANFLPGLLLQALLIVFLILYLWHAGTRAALENVARYKQEAGYAFAFVSYVIAAALLPELLRIVFFQRGKITVKNLWNFLAFAPFWGGLGMLIDLFYRMQTAWFGSGHDLATVVLKMSVDQFLFSPFIAVPLTVGYLHWRAANFRLHALREFATSAFFAEHVFPTAVASWCIWIPGVSLVYFMPPLLQIPVAVLIQAFWVLILATISERHVNEPGDVTISPLP